MQQSIELVIITHESIFYAGQLLMNLIDGAIPNISHKKNNKWDVLYISGVWENDIIIKREKISVVIKIMVKFEKQCILNHWHMELRNIVTNSNPFMSKEISIAISVQTHLILHISKVCKNNIDPMKLCST